MAIRIPKINQGRTVRVATGVGFGLVALVVAVYVGQVLSRYLPETLGYRVYVQYGAAAVVFVALGTVAFFWVNKPKVVDFLVATESEMKKVSWSSKAELVGSTLVVIGTVVTMGLLIFVCDVVFKFVFDTMGLW